MPTVSANSDKNNQYNIIIDYVIAACLIYKVKITFLSSK